MGFRRKCGQTNLSSHKRIQTGGSDDNRVSPLNIYPVPAGSKEWVGGEGR